MNNETQTHSLQSNTLPPYEFSHHTTFLRTTQGEVFKLYNEQKSKGTVSNSEKMYTKNNFKHLKFNVSKMEEKQSGQTSKKITITLTTSAQKPRDRASQTTAVKFNSVFRQKTK